MTSSPIIPLDLTKVLNNAQLPALPQSAIRFLELSQDPNTGPNEFAQPIESDPGLAGQVLRFVNSSYFGFTREISNVKLAINLVGIRTIKNFALWSAVFSLMPNPKCGPFDLKGLWQDSLRRAVLARRIAQALGFRDPEEPFAAALLQDMAVPLLAKEVPEIYIKLLETREKSGTRLSDLERKVFGWTHADAAAVMAQRWNLPDAFAVLIQNHLDIDRWSAQPKADAGSFAVALSALLPSAADEHWTDAVRFEELYISAVPPGCPATVELLEQIDHEFVEFAPVLKMTMPSRTLADYYRELTAAAAEQA